MLESNDKTLKGLLAAIRKNPDEDTPRLVLADWIDENMPDQHALAELYRGGAKKWLENLCEECRQAEGDDPEEHGWFTYKSILREAKRCIKDKEPGFSVGNMMSAQDILHENMEHFWVCIEVVLGMKVPDNFKTDSYFSCAC